MRCFFCISIVFIFLWITFLSSQQRSGDLLLLPGFLLKRRHVSKMKVAVYEKKPIYRHSQTADSLLQKITSCVSLQSLKVFLCPAATEVTYLTLLPSLAWICLYFIQIWCPLSFDKAAQVHSRGDKPSNFLKFKAINKTLLHFPGTLPYPTTAVKIVEHTRKSSKGQLAWEALSRTMGNFLSASWDMPEPGPVDSGAEAGEREPSVSMCWKFLQKKKVWLQDIILSQYSQEGS